MSDTLSSLTAELSEISRARQLEQLGGGGAVGRGEGGVRVEGGAQLNVRARRAFTVACTASSG